MIKSLIILSVVLNLVYAQVNWNGQDWALNCDFNGNDFANVPSTGELCSSKCEANSACTHYSWNNYLGGTCWLKQNQVSKNDAFFKNGNVCGVISYRLQGNNNNNNNNNNQNGALLWSDEFNGGLIEWNQEIGGHGWGNNEKQYYTNSNAIVQNGFLKIIAKRETIGQNQYTSARLLSRKAFKYGIFEARIKVPRGSGTWPAFWLLSAKRPLNWPLDGEIDVLEHWGTRPFIVDANIHTGKYNHAIGTNKGGSITLNNLYDDFHLYKLDWNSQRLIFYVNNNQIFRYDRENGFDAWPYDTEFNIILNLAIGGNPFNSDNIDNSIFPTELVVDYVRQYAN